MGEIPENKKPFAFRIFIARDYNNVDPFILKFNEDSVAELEENGIENEVWKRTISRINGLCREAAKITFFEDILNFITLYIFFALRKSHHEMCMDKLDSFIDEQNSQIYEPLGIHLVYPSLNGFRFVEIVLNNETRIPETIDFQFTSDTIIIA